MTRLTISHSTFYRYREPVWLGPHRLMLRPRESRELKLLSARVTTSVPSTLSWAGDVFGNSVATAVFRDKTDLLRIDSTSVVDIEAAAWPVFDIAGYAMAYPFRYGDEEWADLGALAAPQYAGEAERLLGWARGFVYGSGTNTLALLKDLNAAIPEWVRYQSRDEEGTQSPMHTLDRGWGSCRDLAVLFAEAARCLGFGARIVSGYIHSPDRQRVDLWDNGSTHAWAEVYVPGAGWITFDPTHRAVGTFNLVPVAVARSIAQAMPVTGNFIGMTDAFLGMSVEVDVTAQKEAPQPA